MSQSVGSSGFGRGRKRTIVDRGDSPVDTEPCLKQARVPTVNIVKQTTCARAISTRLEWKIDNFEKLIKLFKTGQNLVSRKFSSPACPAVIWELHAYPAGKREEDSNNVSFFLRQVGMNRPDISDQALLTDFQMFCLSDQEKVSICRDTKDFTHQQGRGKFQVNKEKIQSAIRSDNSLLVVCELEFFAPGIKLAVDSDDGDSLEKIMADDELQTPSSDISPLLDSDILPDCTIKVGEEDFKAHRCILALHSDVFRSMFSNDEMVEARDGVIEITDSYAEPVRGMIEFMYRGETSMIDEYALDLLGIAEKYGIQKLKDKCERYLGRAITAHNVFQTVAFADLYNANLLLSACLRFMQNNYDTLLRSQEWMEIKESQPKLAANLLEHVLLGTTPNAQQTLTPAARPRQASEPCSSSSMNASSMGSDFAPNTPGVLRPTITSSTPPVTTTVNTTSQSQAAATTAPGPSRSLVSRMRTRAAQKGGDGKNMKRES